jgi:hypothetical protein
VARIYVPVQAGTPRIYVTESQGGPVFYPDVDSVPDIDTLADVDTLQESS